MSIMRCEYCDKRVDTDFEEMFSPQSNERYKEVLNHVCEDCLHTIESEDKEMKKEYINFYEDSFWSICSFDLLLKVRDEWKTIYKNAKKNNTKGKEIYSKEKLFYLSEFVKTRKD